jgi:hypothetical protein
VQWLPSVSCCVRELGLLIDSYTRLTCNRIESSQRERMQEKKKKQWSCKVLKNNLIKVNELWIKNGKCSTQFQFP